MVVGSPGRRPLYVQVRDELEVGRECDGIILADPLASRRHATITPRQGSVEIEDMGSTNGTFLDGRQLSSPVLMTPGSVVKIGDTTLQLGPEERDATGSAGGPLGASRATAVPGSLGGPVRAVASVPADVRETSMDAVARAVEQAPPAVKAAEFDHGTITIVFSDIESSTERATSMGDSAWMKVLAAHNDTIRAHVEEWGGTVVKNQGDGFMLTFNGARQALRAMVDVQAELDEFARDHPDMGVRIRVGVHTGEVIAEEGDIFGKHVMLAARVGGLADGGEILVSSIVREIASARGDLDFGDPRAVEFKGIQGDHLVYPFLWRRFSAAT